MVLNVTFNNISVISWRSALLVEETRGPGENHRPVISHWQTLSHNYTPPWSRFELTISVVIGTDCIGSCKSNYHMITATTAPSKICHEWLNNTVTHECVQRISELQCYLVMVENVTRAYMKTIISLWNYNFYLTWKML
jgi:hypothetical protein